MIQIMPVRGSHSKQQGLRSLDFATYYFDSAYINLVLLLGLLSLCANLKGELSLTDGLKCLFDKCLCFGQIFLYLNVTANRLECPSLPKGKKKKVDLYIWNHNSSK